MKFLILFRAYFDGSTIMGVKLFNFKFGGNQNFGRKGQI